MINTQKLSKAFLEQIKELKKEDWGQWKKHPITKMYKQYLTHNRDSIVDRWLLLMETGAFFKEDRDLLIKQHAYREVLSDLIDLEHEAIMDYYKGDIEEVEKEDE